MTDQKRLEGPTAQQFWEIRYIFIPVLTPPFPGATAGHASLLAIPPEIKTVEYIDSASENSDQFHKRLMTR